MKRDILIGILAIAAIVIAGYIAQAQESPTKDATLYRAGKGVTCEVICNGNCSSAPPGWILVESTGESGSYGAQAGRCTHDDYPGKGIETMCCYFQE